MESKHIRIEDFDYELPDERIAKYPIGVRDASKLLIYRHGDISEHQFCELPEFLPTGSLLVFNNTKVIQARLHFHKETGALIEIFCLEPYNPQDYQQNFGQHSHCQWVCLVGNQKKWKSGVLSSVVDRHGEKLLLQAEVVGRKDQSVIIEFRWDCPELTFSEMLEAMGELPIPPYLHRNTEEKDKETYQTVYSKIKGSVAAPTAGLHFTQRVLNEIDERGIERDEITLHVGAGTFRPVKSAEMGDHEMHSEYIYVTLQSIEKLIRHGGRCIAVGTTTVRTLESLYYVGIKVLNYPDIAETELHVEQWMPYEVEEKWSKVSTLTALTALREYMVSHQLSALQTSTQIIILPGYRYHMVERMITNFHMPKSTLLLLVSALIGDDWKRVYHYALHHDFRFLSYGDSSLLIP